MKIKEFEVETWMTIYENDCEINLTETSMKSLSLKDLQKLVDEDIMDHVMELKQDYGHIVGSPRLKQAILSLYKTGDDSNIAITHGAINANELVMMTLLEPGDHIVSLFPSYQQMYDFPHSLGCDVSLIELDEGKGWLPSIDDFKRVVNEKTKMICLNSPNNPTGTTIKGQLMNDIIDLAKQYNCYILCDEIYRGLGTNTKDILPSFSDQYEKAIVTQSLSKVFSFAGLRLGWIKAEQSVIDLVNLRRDYHIISSGPMNDYLGALVLENKDVILDRNRKICAKNKELLKQWLKKNPLFSCVIPDEGTVCFLHYDLPLKSQEFCERLQKETGVFFVPGKTFGKEYYLRFGLTHEAREVEEGLRRLENWYKRIR